MTRTRDSDHLQRHQGTQIARLLCGVVALAVSGGSILADTPPVGLGTGGRVPSVSMDAASTSDAARDARAWKALAAEPIAATLQRLRFDLDHDRASILGGPMQVTWTGRGDRFLFRGGGEADLGIVLVDPATDRVEPLISDARLRAVLRSVAPGSPVSDMNIVGMSRDESRVVISVAGQRVEIDARSDRFTSAGEDESDPTVSRVISNQRPTTFGDLVEVASPDGRRFLTLIGHNLAVRSAAGGPAVALTTDGRQRLTWINSQESAQGFNVFWAPDSRRIAAVQLDTENVWYEPLPHWRGAHPEFEPVAYPRAGEPMHRFRLWVIDVDSKERLPIDTGDTTDEYVDLLGWRADAAAVFYRTIDREHKRLRLWAADPRTGVSRLLLEERRSTYLDTPMTLGPELFFPLAHRGGFLYLSERSGWRQIEQYDETGRRKRDLTSGPFPVHSIVAIDELAGWVYFRSSRSAATPYDLQLYRTDFAGNAPRLLTDPRGSNDIIMAPSRRFFVAQRSTPEIPPVVELRRSDGRLLRILSQARIDRLSAAGYAGIERFAAPSEEGVWTMHGVVARPFEFDPNRRYPVVEFLYGGMQAVETPREFYGFGRISASPILQGLMHAGFVVVIADAPGTPERGRAFQDATYGIWPRSVIGNHVHWIEAAASTRPWMDLDHVGVYGHSWGGYMAQRAMIDAPGFYRVAVAHASPSDFYDHPTYIEPFLGLPQNNPAGYVEGSNLLRVDRIAGPVLVMPMPLDVNAGFSPGMKWVDAMIRAHKDVDMFIVPEASHRLNCCGPDTELYQTAYVLRYLAAHLKP